VSSPFFTLSSDCTILTLSQSLTEGEFRTHLTVSHKGKQACPDPICRRRTASMEPMEREAFLLHLVEIHRLPAIGRATGTTWIVPSQVDSVLWLKHDPLRLARQPAETLVDENTRLHNLAQQYRISTSRQELVDLGVRVRPPSLMADVTWYEHGQVVFDCSKCRSKFRSGYPDGSKGCSNLGRPMPIALAKSHVQLHVPDNKAAQDSWKLEVYSYGAGPGKKNFIAIGQREVKTLSQILVSSACFCAH